MRILVVDDQPLSGMLICKLFEADGHSCRVAGTLVEAADVVSTETTDGMVVDLQLPDESIVSWLEQISRDWPRLTQKTVVATSAALGADQRRRIAAFGAVLLLRPFSVETLRSIVVDLTGASPVTGGNGRECLEIASALPLSREEATGAPERRGRDRRAS